MGSMVKSCVSQLCLNCVLTVSWLCLDCVLTVSWLCLDCVLTVSWLCLNWVILDDFWVIMDDFRVIMDDFWVIMDDLWVIMDDLLVSLGEFKQCFVNQWQTDRTVRQTSELLKPAIRRQKWSCRKSQLGKKRYCHGLWWAAVKGWQIKLIHDWFFESLGCTFLMQWLLIG